MTPSRPLLALIFALLAGCAEPSNLPEHPAPPGPMPSILPLDQLLATDPANQPPVSGDALAARAASLRARAAALP